MLDVDALAAMLAPIIAGEIDKAVAPLNVKIAELEAREPLAGPPGEKGERGEPGEKGLDGKDGNDGLSGKDGAGIADLLRDNEGNLVATFTDGRLKNLGPIQGANGKDGRDGFGFDDMDVSVLDDDRTIELSFRRGEEEKAFTLKWPTVIDRGVFKAGQDYEPGDGVTWGGQFFICNVATNIKPDESKDGKPWRLAVRKGRDGKDVKHG
jgi:hypothetical protein